MTSKSFNLNKDPIVKYIVEHSVRYSEAQSWLIEKTLKHNMSLMLSSGEEMQLLANMCKLIGAKKTLDIGVFTGYSALTIASSLPEDGKVFALDITDEYLHDFCEPAWKMGGVRNKIEFIKNSALLTLEQLIKDKQTNSFDFAFIDADKENYDQYYEACLKLIRPGGLIAIDNVLWGGSVFDPVSQSSSTVAIRKLNDTLKDDDRINISMIRMGDGVTIAFKK